MPVVLGHQEDPVGQDERGMHVSELVGMAGFRPNTARQAEVLPGAHASGDAPSRHRPVTDGRTETRAREQGFTEMFLDTATNQPEAVAFYRSLGYHEVGRETRPEWSWTLIYFTKPLP